MTFGLVLAAGVLVRLAVAAAFHGSFDIVSQTDEGRIFASGRPVYTETTGNKLPLGYALPAAMLLLSSLSGLPVTFTMKLPAIAGDVLAAAVIRGAARRSDRSSTVLAAIYLLNPATVMLSAYHGNVDPLMAALMIAASLLASRGAPLGAGAVLGAAIALKPPAVLALPLLLMRPATAASRGWLAAAAVGVPVALSLPFALDDPGFPRVFDYASLYGVWGVPLLLEQSRNVVTQLTTGAPVVIAMLEQVNRVAIVAGRYVAAAVLVAWFFWIARRRDTISETASREIAATFLVFYVVAPGFGVQYLGWALPFLLVHSWRLGIAYVAVITPFLAGRYAQALLPEKYGVESVTAKLAILSGADLALVVATGGLAVLAWLSCLLILWRLVGEIVSGRISSSRTETDR